MFLLPEPPVKSTLLVTSQFVFNGFQLRPHLVEVLEFIAVNYFTIPIVGNVPTSGTILFLVLLFRSKLVAFEKIDNFLRTGNIR